MKKEKEYTGNLHDAEAFNQDISNWNISNIEKIKLKLNRCQADDKQTLGELHLLTDNESVLNKWMSLELPDLNNQKYISRIPSGTYTAHLHTSPKFGKCLWIQDVPNRSEILIHKGNYAGSKNPKTGKPDIKGCILIGQNHIDINNDGIKDVTSSEKSINHLLSLIQGLDFIKITINDE